MLCHVCLPGVSLLHNYLFPFYHISHKYIPHHILSWCVGCKCLKAKPISNLKCYWESAWQFFMWRFRLEVVANTFWQMEHVVSPLWIPRWFVKEPLLLNVLKQISQDTLFFSFQPDFQEKSCWLPISETKFQMPWNFSKCPKIIVCNHRKGWCIIFIIFLMNSKVGYEPC